jgi:hypothetical protein
MKNQLILPVIFALTLGACANSETGEVDGGSGGSRETGTGGSSMSDTGGSMGTGGLSGTGGQ